MVRRAPIAGRGKTAGGIRYQVKKTLLGYSVKYRCPMCQASFTASLNDAGKRELILERRASEMSTTVRGGVFLFGLVGWAANTFFTAVFACLIVAFSELIKLLIDIQANTQHTAANA